VNITRVARPGRLRLTIAAAIVALAGLVIPLSQIGSAGAAEAAAAGGAPKPTIVLEHGAWADTSSWNGVIRRLQADGYTVYAPPNPLQGLPYDSAYLADFLHSISGPIVLVGHSYGGAVITNAATGDPQVKALVYVDAFAPAQGQTLAQLLASAPGSCAVPANLNVVPFPGAPAGVGEAYIKQSVFPSCMADGLPAAQAHVLAATQLPIATIALTQPTGVPAWQTIPSWAVVGTADHAIPLALQLAMANTAHARITEVHAPHLSMISAPGAVTSVILQAVRATS
jgi:pimeloyl-ACP methyl ester carboxylesterase